MTRMPARQFLHRLLVRAGRAEFLPTTRGLLRAQSFLDGRTNFANGPAAQNGAAEFIADRRGAAQLKRYIFHVSFCGSTFLSRLLDVPGHGLVLREPNCLADLANQYSADAALRSTRDWGNALAAVQRHLARPWAAEEPVIVKPSNWANNLLGDLCADPAAVRPVFLHMDRAAFVEAVIRGGASRIAYTARSAVHLSSASRVDAEFVATALARDADERGKIAALAIVAHSIQIRIFEQASQRAGWTEANWLSFDELTQHPLQAARKAAAALGLSISDGELAASVQRWSGVDAKQPSQAFSREQLAPGHLDAFQQDREIVNSALDWAATAIGF